MPKLAITLEDLKALQPCKDRMDVVTNLIAWNGRAVTAAEAKAAGVSFDDLVWAASSVARNDKAVGRLLRHWTADCAVRVLHIFEKQHPSDMRVRDCIKAARDYANGKIDDTARAAARAPAWAAAWAADGAAKIAAEAAVEAAGANAWTDGAASAAAGASVEAAAEDARAAEEQWQFDRLVEWLSDDEPTPLAIPEIQHATA